MSSFPHGIYYIHDGIMSVCVWKFANEVHTEDVPTVLRNGERMKLSGWAPSLDLGPETDVARPSILTNVSGHLWPPVAPGFSSVQGGLQPWCHGVAMQCDDVALDHLEHRCGPGNTIVHRVPTILTPGWISLWISGGLLWPVRQHPLAYLHGLRSGCPFPL